MSANTQLESYGSEITALIPVLASAKMQKLWIFQKTQEKIRGGSESRDSTHADIHFVKWDMDGTASRTESRENQKNIVFSENNITADLTKKKMLILHNLKMHTWMFNSASGSSLY